MRRVLTALSTAFILAGVLLLLDAGLTLAWQEPVSAIYAKVNQGRLGGDLEQLEREPATPLQIRVLDRLKGDSRRIAFLARQLDRKVKDGRAVARIRIQRIGLRTVVVQGTNPGDLRKGPGHYPDTVLPGMRGTVAIAGHRTTYGAPFREINRLRKGDRIVVEMPYGKFTYVMERTQIVKPSAVYVTRRVSYDRLVLSACHPLYSAAQRIIAFARLEKTEPRGPALRARAL